MIKKVIIIILIILIIVSLGVIGYIVFSQSGISSLTNLWPSGAKPRTEAPPVPENFFPIGTTTYPSGFTNNPSTPNQPQDTTTNQPETTTDRPNLAGVSALGLTLAGDVENERVLFVDKSNGNIYEITAQNDLSRLTSQTLNNIQEVFWGKDKMGERLITKFYQFNQSITLSGLVDSATGTELGSLKNQALGTNISAIAISPDRAKFFTLEAGGGGVIGYVNDWTGKNKKKVWSFPYGDWQATWPKNDIISLTTTPSARSSGYLYFLNLTTGSFSKIISGVNGLTTSVSPDASKVIYSRNNLGLIDLFLYETATKKTSLAGLKTLPEKCFWQNSDIIYCAVPKTITTGQYPDNWYQGKISFSDDIWKIDLKQKITVLVVPIKESLDLVNLVVAPKRGWIYAINKTDNSIQSFSLPL